MENKEIESKCSHLST